jgi:hypothetical protein
MLNKLKTWIIVALFASGLSPINPCLAKTSSQPPPFKVAGKTSRSVQKYLGLTALAETTVDLAGTLAAKCLLKGRPSLKVRAYSLTDCLAGKFRSVSINLKDCSYKKVPLADLELVTDTPLQLRLFKSRKGRAGVAAPVMVSVAGRLEEADVSEALQSREGASRLKFLRLDLPGLGDQHLQVVDPKVRLENSKVKIDTWLITAGAPRDTGISVNIAATPQLESQRFIVLNDVQISSPDITDEAAFSKFSQNLLNPLLDFGKFDRKTHAFRLTQLNLAEKKLQFAGKLLLVPEPVQPTPAPEKLSTR